MDDVQQSLNTLTIETPQKSLEIFKEFYLSEIRRIQNYLKKYLRNQECKAEKDAFTKKIEKFRYRMYQINELVQTEKNYVSNIQTLVNNIKKTLEEQNIISDQESQDIFCNIESIFDLNQKFLKTLLIKYDKVGPYSCIVDQEMLTIIHFFKIYSEYFNNLEYANKVLFQVRESNEAFDKFLTEMTSDMGLESYLIMPFYRLFKYKLLFEDLLKKTDTDHPDYNNIQTAITTFHNVSNHNNEQMKENMESSKLMDLQMTFGGENLVIYDKNRKLLFEETFYFLSSNQQIRVKVYFLNDLILITQKIQVNLISKSLFYKNQQEQYQVNHLELNEQSFISGIKDGKYFQNIFKISGQNDSFTFNCDTQQQKEKIINNVKAIITNLVTIQKFKKGQQYSDMHLIHVNVLGTEERNVAFFNKFTVYIVEITVADFAYKIFIRYREMVDLEKEMKKLFSDLKFPHLETRNFITNHKTKAIESRKLLIENFLQKVLSTEVVIKSDKIQQILERLGLPLQFYELPEIQKQPIYQLYQSRLSYAQTIQIQESMVNLDQTNVQCHLIIKDLQQSFFTVKDFQQSFSPVKNLQQSFFKFNKNTIDFTEDLNFIEQNQQEDLSIQQILELSQKTLNRQLCIRLSSVFNLSKVKMYTLEVQTIDKDIYKISVDEKSPTLNLRERITNELKLQHSLDFRIYLIDLKGNMRILDEEEQVMKIIGTQEYNMQQQNFIQKLSIKVGFTKIEQQILLFKKYLWLPNKIESLDYRQDFKRLSLIVKQIFDDISRMQFQLGFKEYSLFASLYLYIYYNQLVQNIKPSNFPLNIVQKLIPNIIYNTYKEITWVESIIHDLEVIILKLAQLSENNKNQLQEDTQNIDIHIDKILLAQQIIINTIKCNFLFGVAQYHVETHRKDAKQEGFNLPSSIWLGIKHDKIMFLTSDGKNKIREYFLEQLEKVTVFPTSITIGIKGENVKEYRFNTLHSFEISQMIADYKEIKSNMEFHGINIIINNQKN